MTIVDFDDTGKITRVVTYPITAPVVLSLYPDSIFCPPGFTASDSTHYVVDGEVVPRPEMSITTVGNTLVGVPVGASVIIEGVEYIADGSYIHLEFFVQESHIVNVVLWPYLNKVITIDNQTP